MKLIDGKDTAKTIRAELKQVVDEMERKPGLGVILVGDRTDSKTYVRMKVKACAEVGIQSFQTTLDASATEEDILKAVNEMNENENIHGILVQLPLPEHVSEEKVLSTVQLAKDVDGLHPGSIAQLSISRPRRSTSWLDTSESFCVPCTPQGCIELLDRFHIPIEGQHAVILGRSNIVGIPVALLLMQRNATITVCHSRTKNIESYVRQADIVIAAVGKAEMVRKDWIKPGATVIDVGINSIDDPQAKRGYRLVGDVAFDEVKEIAGAMTPVPGGVGPMTIAMLLKNTVKCAKLLQHRQ